MKSKGTILVLLSAICYGLAPFFSKIAIEEGLNTYSLLTLRAGLCLPILAAVLFWRKERFRISKEGFKAVVILAFFYALTLSLLISSYTLIPTGLATSLHFGYPAFTVMLAFFVHRYRPRLVHGVCIMLSLIGIYLMQGSSESLNTLGVTIAVISGLTHAAYMIQVQDPQLVKMSPLKLNFYTHLFTLIIIACAMPFQKTLAFSLTPRGFGAVVGITVFVTILAVTLLQTGLRYISAPRASILSTLEPVTSIIVGVLIFAEELTALGVVGLFLVLISVIVLSLSKEENSPV